MKEVIRHIAASLVLAGVVCAAAQSGASDSYRRRVQAVTRIPGLAAFWDFGQREDGPQGTGRFIAHTKGGPQDRYALDARNIPHDYWRAGRPASYSDFPLLGRGPFGQAVHFSATADRELRPVLAVPRSRLHDTPLDVKGPRVSAQDSKSHRNPVHQNAGPKHRVRSFVLAAHPRRITAGESVSGRGRCSRDPPGARRPRADRRSGSSPHADLPGDCKAAASSPPCASPARS